MPVYVGMKHAPPFIADAVAAAAGAGTIRLIGLPLAPHYAEMSLGAYLSALEEGMAGRAASSSAVFTTIPRSSPPCMPSSKTLARDSTRSS